MDLSDLNEFNTFTREYGGVLGLAIKTIRTTAEYFTGLSSQQKTVACLCQIA